MGLGFDRFEDMERSCYAPHLGEERLRVYYCDPYCSWQKPRVENAHTLLRRVLPKGTSFDGLTQADVDLICSHINSYPRAELGWRSPFEMLPEWVTGEPAARLRDARDPARRGQPDPVARRHVAAGESLDNGPARSAGAAVRWRRGPPGPGKLRSVVAGDASAPRARPTRAADLHSVVAAGAGCRKPAIRFESHDRA